MNLGLLLLGLNAAAIGLLHTLVGPDHYVPFVALAQARRWTPSRAALFTAACGLGHLASALALAGLAIALGRGAEDIAGVDTVRGAVATWGLMVFGALYGGWGLSRALHAGAAHRHEHRLDCDDGGSGVTCWVLFIVFGFGPCEALVPLMVFPAAARDWAGVLTTSGCFGLATLAAMVGLVTLGLAGARRVRLGLLERYRHALAGAAIFATGAAMRVFGL